MTKLRGVRRVQQDGKTYRYHRATGTRLPDTIPEDHPDFIAAWHAAEQGKTAPKPDRIAGPAGTVAATWLAFARSAQFAALSPDYARIITADCKAICAKGGQVRVAQIAARHIRADLAPLAPNAARKRLKAWRALFRAAQAAGWIDADPSAGITPPKEVSTQHPPWTPDDVEAFRAHWPVGTQQRAAFELMHWTGARVSDIVRLGPGMIDAAGWLSFRQQKTGGAVSIPWHRTPPSFANAADQQAARSSTEALPRRGLVWLTTPDGTPRSRKSVSSWFSKAARAAGITAPKSAHGLRVARAITLAENGATTHQIAAWTGHQTLAEVEHYSRAADARRLLSADEPGTSIVQVAKP